MTRCISPQRSPGTRSLSPEAAAHVDLVLAPVLDSCGPARIEKAVDAARARFDPVEPAAEEAAQSAGWGVQLRHRPSGRYAGTAWLEITGDRTCVHPWCERNARDCDLDHITAHVEMDDGGPPGQTGPGNLAALCGRHHRLKTFGGWSYERDTDDTYT